MIKEGKVEDFRKFLREFQNESDRGAAILAAAMLDSKLLVILEEFLIDCKQTKELLNGGNAAVGTLKSRLDLAFSVGLISQEEYDECNLIRRIRNVFAHKFENEFSFQDDRICDLCWNLKSSTPGPKKDFKQKARFLFINAVIMLYLNWMYREEHIKSRKLERPNWEEITWNHLSKENGA